MAVDLTDLITYKRLVVVSGANILYYEDLDDMTAGTMTALTDSADDIDTSDQLNMFEAYQKVFIANGANLKVADFVNTKITVTAMTAPPAKGDILTQDQGSDDIARMVVDFVNADKTLIYGYAYYASDATAFVTTVDISSNNATATMQADGETAGDPIPNAQITAVTAGPHWYDWIVYPDVVLTVDASTKSYGTMPNKAHLGCLYKGRGIISGNPEHPEQWYMTRQTNLWDFAYFANDTGTPVAGGNADAGEAGDIVRALIPYKDDFLIFGCASTLWYMAGDPGYGGDLIELSLTAGILGANSHCWDNQDNLYILATTGILKIPKGFGIPENLTELSWPNFIKALAYNPTLHRITMGYDRIRHGIVISKVTLADGTNSCWWYDLKAEGLFPESYPEECGMYSMFYYEANDPDNKELLFGCKDGRIRAADDTAKSDDIGDTDEAIDSYYTIGPIRLGRETREGHIESFVGVPAGGRTVGSLIKSSDISWRLWGEETADELVEKMLANTGPKRAGTIKALGSIRGRRERPGVRAMYAGIRLGNDTIDETWSLERLQANIRQGGRLK